MVALEAMAAGAISIWSPAANPLAASQEVPGFLCEVDVASLSSAMNQAMRLSRRERMRLSALARTYARGAYSWESCIGAWLALYARVGRCHE